MLIHFTRVIEWQQGVMQHSGTTFLDAKLMKYYLVELSNVLQYFNPCNYNLEKFLFIFIS